MYVYGTCLFYVCCIDCVGVCVNVCYVAAIVKDNVFCLGVYVCVRGVMDVVFSVCIGMHVAVGACL